MANAGDSNSDVERIDIRPNALKFIKQVSSTYELIIWSDKPPSYVNAILQALDPLNDHITYRLYQRDCLKYPGKCEILAKPVLSIKNRYKDNIIYVGASLLPAILNSENFVPILPYKGDKSDKELDSLLEWLQILNEYTDIPKILAKKFGYLDFLKKVAKETSPQTGNGFSYTVDPLVFD